jgi:hypothetical protein
VPIGCDFREIIGDLGWIRTSDVCAPDETDAMAPAASRGDRFIIAPRKCAMI